MKSWISKTAIAHRYRDRAYPSSRMPTPGKSIPRTPTSSSRVRHMMISNVKGQFQKTSGTITINGNDPTSAKIDATIDAASIDTRVDKRDAHLKSPAFLDVDKYPTITFKSTKVEADGPEQMESHGRSDAARRHQAGRARGRRHRDADHRSDGQYARGRIGDDENQPQRFRPDVEQPLETGGVMVGDEVAISIDVEAIKK